MMGGQAFLGRYQLVREIARSNDIVWEGVDPKMNRRVAVKELALAPNLTGSARRERIERFYREARAAGTMNQTNIVTIYEVGEDRGRYFIAMEYLEGQTLRDRLRVGGMMSLSEAVGITTALCDALEYAHARGVIHRDIKPDNIYMLPGGQVKLTDFGIARITGEDQLTVAGQVFGTPSYMSPEQVIGKAIDARSDLFSLGIMLYEMVAGKKPFTGDSVVTITYHILNDPIPPLPPGLPLQLESFLQRATAKDPAHRFASASDFRAALLLAVSSQASGRTGAFTAHPNAAPAYPPPANNYATGYGNAPQMTAQYGAQTQMAVAPGYAAPPPGVMPQAQPLYSEPPASSGGGGKIALAVAAALFIIVGSLFGGMWIIGKINKPKANPPSTTGFTFPTAPTGGTSSSPTDTTAFPSVNTRPPLDEVLKGTGFATPSPSAAPASTTAPAQNFDPNKVQSARNYINQANQYARQASSAREQYETAQRQIDDNQGDAGQLTNQRNSAYQQMTALGAQARQSWEQARNVAPPGSPEFQEAGSRAMLYKNGDPVDIPTSLF